MTQDEIKRIALRTGTEVNFGQGYLFTPNELQAFATAILAQEPQEAVAYATFYENGIVKNLTRSPIPTMDGKHLEYKPLYTSPPSQDARVRELEEMLEMNSNEVLFEQQERLIKMVDTLSAQNEKYREAFELAKQRATDLYINLGYQSDKELMEVCTQALDSAKE